jgi:hypothetical protein
MRGAVTDDRAVATPTPEGAPSTVASTPRPAVAGERMCLAGAGPLSEEQAFEVLKSRRLSLGAGSEAHDSFGVGFALDAALFALRLA